MAESTRLKKIWGLREEDVRMQPMSRLEKKLQWFVKKSTVIFVITPSHTIYSVNANAFTEDVASTLHIPFRIVASYPLSLTRDLENWI
jgi:hypothetical protein